MIRELISLHVYGINKEAYVILLLIAVAIIIWDIDIRARVCRRRGIIWDQVERLSIKIPKLKKVEALCLILITAKALYI